MRATRPRRFTVLNIFGVICLIFAIGAAADLAVIAAAAFMAMWSPLALLVDVGAVLLYLTFYPSIGIAAVTLLIGAIIVWRRPDAARIGLLLVGLGVLSAAFAALIFVPHA